MAYRIYTECDLAETSRDDSRLVYKELGYKNNLDDAVKVVNDYIQNRFSNKNTQLEKGEGDIIFWTIDVRSWGVKIIIKEVKID